MLRIEIEALVTLDASRSLMSSGESYLVPLSLSSCLSFDPLVRPGPPRQAAPPALIFLAGPFFAAGCGIKSPQTRLSEGKGKEGVQAGCARWADKGGRTTSRKVYCLSFAAVVVPEARASLSRPRVLLSASDFSVLAGTVS